MDAGSTISGRDPVEFAELIDEGRDTFRVMSREIVEVLSDVSTAVAALTTTVDSANTLVATVGEELARLTATGTTAVQEVRNAVADTRQLVNDVRGGRGTIGTLATDRARCDNIAGLTHEAELTARSLRETTALARNAIDDFTSPSGSGQQISQTLVTTLQQIREVTSDLARGTEALKRNLLFRGFFRDRGFFDLDTISPWCRAIGPNWCAITWFHGPGARRR